MSGMGKWKIVFAAGVAAITLLAAGCGQGGTASDSKLSGEVLIDGSSTVFPITEAVAEEFQKNNPRVRVTVGVSGTGGGFKKFSRGEIDIADASRPIKDKEKAAAQENNIEYIELPVAYDGISVLVNPSNDWVDHLTIDELKKIWEPGSKVKRWSDVRPNWPDTEIKLFGPGADSGTFDYFTEEVVGKAQASRSDYSASEDDNVLVQGISGEKGALGYMGYSYYVENKDKLKVVPSDGGKGPVTPSNDTIENGKYSPLSRPLFIYVRTDSLKKPEIREFVKFYLTKGPRLAEEVGYIPLPQERYSEDLKKVEAVK